MITINVNHRKSSNTSGSSTTTGDTDDEVVSWNGQSGTLVQQK